MVLNASEIVWDDEITWDSPSYDEVTWDEEEDYLDNGIPKNADTGLGVIGRVSKAGRQAVQSIGKGAGEAMTGLATQVEHSGVLPPPYMTPGMLADWKKIAPEQYEAVKTGKEIGKNPLSDVLREGSKAYKVEEGRPLGIFSDFINGLAESIPSMALSYIDPVAGTAATFEQFAGNKYDQYISEGKDPRTAFNASTLNALINTPVEMAGNLLQIGKIVKLLDTKVFSGLGKGFKKYIKTVLENALLEGGENAIQHQGDIITDTYATNPDADPVKLGKQVADKIISIQNAKETGQEFLTGAGSGTLLTGTGVGLRIAQNMVNKKGWIGKESADIIEIRKRIQAKEEEKGRTLSDDEVNNIVKEVRSSKPIDILTTSEIPPSSPGKMLEDGYARGEITLDDLINIKATAPPDIAQAIDQIIQKEDVKTKPIDIIKPVGLPTREQQIRSDMEVRGTVPGFKPIAGISAEESAQAFVEEKTPYSEEIEQQYKRSQRGSELLKQDLALQDPYLQDIAFRIITGEQLDLTGLNEQDRRSIEYILNQPVESHPGGAPVPVRESMGLVTIGQQAEPEFVPAGLLSDEQKKLPAPKPGLLPPPPTDVGPGGPGQFEPPRRGPINKGTGPVIPMGVLAKGENPKDYTGSELRQIAKDQGLEIPKGMLKKTDMINLIKKGVQQNAETIRSNERPISEGGIIQEGGTGESGQNLQLETPEEPSGKREEIINVPRETIEIPEINTTGEAVEFAKTATPEQLKKVQELRDEYEVQRKSIVDEANKAKRSGNKKRAVELLNEAMAISTKSQFMREVIESKAEPERFDLQKILEKNKEITEVKPEIPIQDVINNPKATQDEVIQEKKKLKDQLVRGVKSGEFDGAVRFGNVDEINTILKEGRMPVSKEYGAIHAQPIVSKDDDVFAAYGAYDKHNMAIIFPKESIIKKTDAHTKEVLIDEKVNVKDLKFLIDGHERVYTFDELSKAIKIEEKPSIRKDLKNIEVNVKAIMENGEKVTIKENASDAVNENKSRLAIYQELLGCLL